jgi:hypothetical protein
LAPFRREAFMTIVIDHAIDNPAPTTPLPHTESPFFHGVVHQPADSPSLPGVTVDLPGL